MLRKIKKSIKYFIIMIGIVLMVPTVLYLLLQTATVQTFIVKRITKHFSAELKSTISVGSFEYKFFNRLTINNLLIKDHNNDTLLYSREIRTGIRKIDFRGKSFGFGKVTLVKPVIGFITDSTGQMNLTWYLNLLKNPSDTTKKEPVSITINQIELANGRFSLINRLGNISKTPVDFSNLHLNAINGTIEDLKILNDSLTFNIYNLSFLESSGFLLKKMTGSVLISGSDIDFSSGFISTGNSLINVSNLGVKTDSGSFKNFAESVRLDISLEKSLISSEDLQYFIGIPDSLNESLWLSGKILGTISELRGRKIRIAYRDFTTLDCDFDFSGLPKIENTFLYIGVNKLRTNAKDLEKIRIPGKNPIVIPEALKNLGDVTFNGSFTGFTTDFVTYGEIRTKEGNIRTDLSLRPEKGGRYKIKGLLNGSDISLGDLSGKPELLGQMSMHANIDGYAYSLKKFEGNLTGKVDSIDINNYSYRNITLNGQFTEKTWDGSIDILDNNIKLNLLGLLNFRNELPEFDFTLNISKAKLYALHFDKVDSTASVSLLLTSNFKGNSIDNIDGEIKLLNSNFVKYGQNLELYDFSVRTYKEDNKPVLSLRTDFVDADIKGYYNFSELAFFFKNTLSDLMPSQFHERGRQNDVKKNDFTFEINFKNTEKINNFLRTGFTIAENSYLKGAIFADSLVNFRGKAANLSIKNNVFNDLSLQVRISGSQSRTDISSASLSILGQSELKDFTVSLKTIPDNFDFVVNWDNKDQVLNQGNISAHGTIARNNDGNHNSILKIDIDSSKLYSDNKLWRLSRSTVNIDSNSVEIKKLAVKSDDRYYLVNGTVSENPSDTLRLEFKGISMTPLNMLIDKKKTTDPTALHFDIKGIVEGRILLSNVYKNILLAGNINVDNFSILGSEFGNISIHSTLDNVKKVVNISASNNLNGVKMLDIAGTYDPSVKRMNLSARATKLPVTFLNPLLKVFASDVNGVVSGKLLFNAEPGSITLHGSVKAEDASMKINYLGTKYFLNDSIRFDRKGINFNNVTLTDSKGNAANLSGSVNHKNFKDYVVALVVTINSSSFQVLNTQPKDNELFYGTVYASGVAKINIDQNTMGFDISAKTGKNSKLSIPLNKGLSVSEYSYISFVDPNKETDKKKQEAAKPAPKAAGIDLNMNLEVTPDAEILIIFDSKVGDIMKGHGSSENLNVSMNKKGDFNIFGDYIIEDGEYTFTLGSIINKPFSVENGGKIMFTGSLYNAEIDLNARYLNLKTSLSPILPEEKYAERIRVEPQLTLTGKLFNPIVAFDIILPDADEETKTYLKNSISTEEELTRQVFALLLMNSFISIGSTTTSPSATTSGTSAMAATTFEMVSSQISNWLSQISKDVDIGVLIRPGYNAITPQEAQLALSTQLLNNRVVLNGNFDVKGYGATVNTTSNQLTGDFDAELKLTEKLRFKVFSRYNDIYTGTGVSPYTQGLGIFYKQDFNKFGELFKKKSKSEIKKEDETKAKKKKNE